MSTLKSPACIVRSTKTLSNSNSWNYNILNHKLAFLSEMSVEKYLKYCC